MYVSYAHMYVSYARNMYVSCARNMYVSCARNMYVSYARNIRVPASLWTSPSLNIAAEPNGGPTDPAETLHPGPSSRQGKSCRSEQRQGAASPHGECVSQIPVGPGEQARPSVAQQGPGPGPPGPAMAAHPRRLLSVCCCLLLLAVSCRGFNVDQRFPVIKEGKTTGSHFGFSVALHRQTVGSQQYLGAGRKGQAISWSPIGSSRPLTLSSSCQCPYEEVMSRGRRRRVVVWGASALKGVRKREVLVQRRLFSNLVAGKTRAGQVMWLLFHSLKLLAGAPKEKALSLKNVNETGAVYSCPITTEMADCTRMDLVQSSKQRTCGCPEFANPSEEVVEGMWLGVTVASQTDLVDGHVLACGHRYVKVLKGGTEEQYRMVGKCYVRGNDLAYDDSDEWQSHSYELCNPNDDMELEGMCNIGISGGMTDTDVYIGSTGSYMWRGNVHIMWRNPDPDKSYDSSVNTFEQNKQKNKRHTYSYMGYSVLEEKKLLSHENYTVVTGSPRNKTKGSVTLGRKENSNIVPVLVIPGDQVGSYFGNSLAITDLNSDNWNDLIVGAPFYFDRSKHHGGAVYVYMNENGSFKKEPDVVLTGPIDSAFGIALAAIGDVNQDGFQDFAVGAPFHETGKVYIWMGSNTLITKEYSQVIEGKSVGDGKFKTFGYSLNGGMDMDDNRYPDILVGSLDDRIALLRARPVILLSTNFTIKPKIVNPKECAANGKPCIRATVCFSYTQSNGQKNLKSVVVKYTVEADMERWKKQRVFFRSSKNGTHMGTIQLKPSGSSCTTLGLDVVPLADDKLEPVVFELSMSLQEQNPDNQGLQDLDSFPILSQNQKLNQRAEINFHKECGTDNKCSSNLQLSAVYAIDHTFKPYPRVGRDQVMQYNRNVKKVVILVEVTNLPAPGRLAEDAHLVMLNITIPKTLTYSAVRFTGHDGECNWDTEGQVICDLGNPLRSNKRVNLRLTFETNEIDLYTRQIESQLQLSTLSEQSDLIPVSVVLLVEISILSTFTIEQPHLQTYFSGEVVGESAMVKTSDVGSLLEYTFNVEVLGTSMGTNGTLAIEFEWPLEVENGKWLLYLTEIIMNGTSEKRCVPPGNVVNLLNLTLTEGSGGGGGGSKRPKRQTVVIGDAESPGAGPAISLLSSGKDTVTLDCASGKARCVTFVCPLLDMQTVAKVVVRSRIWNSTLLEDYSKALRVKVKGKATLKLITDNSAIKMESQTADFMVDIDPLLREEAPYEVPLWIIIVAAGAGILLLGIISVILWKCGFFKRANRREMYEAKAQKAEMKIQPSETEKLTEDY
ncbi:Integrin alpha-3 [Merluccius polli]|uniref:Integrin alpha-3 n=1 Tax=Merluccius polli TaxID=89951 RepID=A0AA47NP37_MERPO|nr:Integrin alpha-3 [Merluccius polli]